jgi:hypothetical protein
MTNYIERYWRDATPQDAIKEPPMVARLRNDEGYTWHIGSLTGIRRDSYYPWYSPNLGSHKQCQVYDAPDPGEGWRLIDVDSEKPQEGDEIYDRDTGTWRRRLRPFKPSALSINRRRIEQPKPEPKYVPFRWEDREQLRGRWIVNFTGQQEYMIDDFLNDDSVLYICGHPAEYFLNWRFLDTGEPVGRKIE